MRRRRVLGLCGSLLAGTAGCLSGPDGPADPPDDRSTQRDTPPTESQTTADSTDPSGESSHFEIPLATVQPGIVSPDSPDSIGVFDEFGQYLVVEFEGYGMEPAYDDFEFRFDGQRFPPIEPQSGLFRDGDWGVTYEGGRGPVVFGLPEEGDASDATLTFDRVTWAPSERVRARLEAPMPSFEVSMSGPDRVGPDADPPLLVTVRNVSDVEGRYVLALNRSGPMVAYAPIRRISGVLEPGQERTTTYDARNPHETDGDPREVVYRLDRPGSEAMLEHTIHPTETTKTPGWTDEGTATASGSQ